MNVRPITGRLRFNGGYPLLPALGFGAFILKEPIEKIGWAGYGNIEGTPSFNFDANNGDITSNPISGHANGADIHPSNISFLPLIAY